MESSAKLYGAVGRADMAEGEWGYFLNPDDDPQAWADFAKYMSPEPVKVKFFGESWEKGPWIVPNQFPANTKAGRHAHNYDTIYIVTKGSMNFNDGSGWYEPGSVRWVRANTTYGPEESGPEGCEFILVSMGPIDVQWEGGDVFDQPT